MRIIGCDFHTRQQTVAMLDTQTGELVKLTLKHEGNNVREFYSQLPRPVRVGIEARGSMPWFLKLMEELGIECLVGHPAEVRAAEAREQKHDRRDANWILKLLVGNAFQQSGCLPKSYKICGLCCGTVISGSGCGRAYKMRCRRLLWRMVYDQAPHCGAQ
jgi:Transposase